MKFRGKDWNSHTCLNEIHEMIIEFERMKWLEIKKLGEWIQGYTLKEIITAWIKPNGVPTFKRMSQWMLAQIQSLKRIKTLTLYLFLLHLFSVPFYFETKDVKVNFMRQIVWLLPVRHHNMHVKFLCALSYSTKRHPILHLLFPPFSLFLFIYFFPWPIETCYLSNNDGHWNWRGLQLHSSTILVVVRQIIFGTWDSFCRKLGHERPSWDTRGSLS